MCVYVCVCVGVCVCVCVCVQEVGLLQMCTQALLQGHSVLRIRSVANIYCCTTLVCVCVCVCVCAYYTTKPPDV
jgi:hypothetical protein